MKKIKKIKKLVSFLGAVVFLFMLKSAFLQANDQLNWLHSAPKKAVDISSRNISTADSARRGEFRVEANLQCYGTNNRSVQNPVRRKSMITSSFEIESPDDGKTIPVKIEFPASVLQGGYDNPAMSQIALSVATLNNHVKVLQPQGAKIKAAGNLITFSLPGVSAVVLSADGTIRTPSLKPGTVSHTQDDGKPISNVQVDYAELSTNNKLLRIVAAFPGEDGFCGGFRSPLMLFFSEERPKFNHSSQFPIYPNEKVYWPEKGAPGYFLAYDRDKNGKIEKKDELFSDHSFHNGFEALKAFDSNRDNIIDKQDLVFSKLQLWRDKNGDGVSQKEELFSASSMIKSISLNYQYNRVDSHFTGNVEERERSNFLFKKNGKEQEGYIVDLWFQRYQGK